MPEVTRVVRSYRDDYESDDDTRSTFSRRAKGDGSYRTVQRYRVTPSRVEEVEVDRRSSRLDVAPRAEHIEVDRRVERWEPERPRSAIDIRPRSTVVERERYIEREPAREPERERTRTVVYERDREPEPAREPERERTRTVVYERDTREPEPMRPWERAARPWESERDVRETDVVRVEKRTTERREEPYELERYQRETEYYDRPEPPPQPIIIRQRAPEPQQIIVQEAPQPPPIVLPPPREEVQIVRQEIREERSEPRPEPRRQEDEYYYRRDVREVRGGDARRSDEDFALERYDRRDVRPRDSVSGDEYSDEDYVVRKKIIRRERSRSHSPHHKRHLAEGALAGAGAAALLANHASKQGTGGDHRGRKMIGGAALGAIGAEVITRARSRYRESREDGSRSRSRSSSRHSHRKIKTAIGLAAAGLAAAAAAKYVSNRKANNEEIRRGRSRTRSLSRRRSYDDDYDDYDDRRARTRSRSVHADPKHRASTIAKAGAATAAVAGVVEHFRNKSRQRNGSRSKSRIRTGAEIAGAGLAGAAVAGLYENRKAKEDVREEVEEDRRERRRSRSRARSVGAYSDPGVDPELGMVQYGTEPVYTHTPAYQQGYDYDPAAVAAGAAYGATRGSRSRRRDSSSDSAERRPSRRRSRSHSRVRDIAGAAAGTAAAAIGINQYKKRKEKKEAERERERRRYEEEAPPENYYARNYPDDGYSPSPPHASGGSYYPETNQFAPPPQAPAGFTHHNNQSTPHVNETNIPPYNPADYAGQQPPNHDPYGYPPRTGDNVSNDTTSRQTPYVPPNINPATASSIPAAPYFPPPPTVPIEEEHDQHQQRRSRDPLESAEEGGVTYTPPSTATPSPLPSRSNSPERPAKSVSFSPLSPTSSRSLARIHQSTPHDHTSDHDIAPSPSNSLVKARAGRTHPRESSPSSTFDSQDLTRHRARRRRRNSDPSSNRPNYRRSQRTASRSPSPSSDESSGEVETLPDRFDAEGRPLDRDGNAYRPRNSNWRGGVSWLHGDSQRGFRGGARTFGSGGQSSRTDYDDRSLARDHRRRGRNQDDSEEEEGEGGKPQEMVEKWAKDFGDVFEGKKSWKDLLRGFVEEAGSLGGSAAGSRESIDDGARERRRRSRRDTDRY